MTTEIVTYTNPDGTAVMFEIEPPEGFRPASSGTFAGQVRDAVRPALDAAHEVIERARELAPDEVKVKFGIKVSGKADWIIAKAATEANFEITLTWKSEEPTA